MGNTARKVFTWGLDKKMVSHTLQKHYQIFCGLLHLLKEADRGEVCHYTGQFYICFCASWKQILVKYTNLVIVRLKI